MSDQSQTGRAKPSDTSTKYNAINFLVRMLLSRMNTCALVQVMKAPYDEDGNAINNTNGNVPAVGFVDVQPLVNLVDGSGQSTPHGTIYKIPYMRLQAGQGQNSAAIICDPQVNDIGICVFADHDISSVKENKAQSNPGSSRQFDMADGLYIGGVLNPSPQMYIGFIGGGVLATPDNGTTWVYVQPGNVQATPDNGTTFIQLVPENIKLTPDKSTTNIQITPGQTTITSAITSIVGSVLNIDVETISATATDDAGTATFTFNGGVNMSATQGITMNKATIDSDGNVGSPATVTANDNVVATSGDVTAGSISLKSHVHTGVTTGAGDTGPATG